MVIVMSKFDKNCGLLSEVKFSKQKVCGRSTKLFEGVVSVVTFWCGGTNGKGKKLVLHQLLVENIVSPFLKPYCPLKRLVPSSRLVVGLGNTCT